MKRRDILLLAGLALPCAGLAKQSCGLPTPEEMKGPFYKARAPRSSTSF